MKLDTVSYCYTEAELAALLELLGCEELPFLHLCAAEDGAALAGLEADQVVCRSGGRVVVDRIAAFLVKSLDGCENYVCARGEQGYAGLFYTPAASLVLTKAGARCAIHPYPAFPPAAERAAKEAKRLKRDARVWLQNASGVWECPAGASGSVPETLLSLAPLVRSDGAPTGKDVIPWRP